MNNALEANGNNCGHDKVCPQLFSRSKSAKNPPLAIAIALKNLDEFYHHPELFLQNIKYSRASLKQQRSESREAVASLAKVLVNYCSLETMKISKYHPNGERRISVAELASMAGIAYKRCLRAIGVLKRAGYINIHCQYERLPNGELKPLIAIKKITARLFFDLGVDSELFRSCQNYIFKQVKRVTKIGKRISFQIKQSFERKKTDKNGALISHPTAVQHKKKEVEKLYHLRLNHPDWTHDQLRAAL